MFRALCRLGDADACVRQGLLVSEREPGTWVDLDTGREEYATLTRRGCDLGSPNGCFLFASLFEYGHVLEPPWPPPGTRDERFEFFRRGCDLDFPPSCFSLGQILHDGRGVTADLEQARTAYEKSCAMDFQQACVSLSILEERLAKSEASEISARVEQLNEKACALGGAYGCANSAVLLSRTNASAERVVELLRRACELRDEASCREAASWKPGAALNVSLRAERPLVHEILNSSD